MVRATEEPVAPSYAAVRGPNSPVCAVYLYSYRRHTPTGEMTRWSRAEEYSYVHTCAGLLLRVSV